MQPKLLEKLIIDKKTKAYIYFIKKTRYQFYLSLLVDYLLRGPNSY